MPINPSEEERFLRQFRGCVAPLSVPRVSVSGSTAWIQEDPGYMTGEDGPGCIVNNIYGSTMAILPGDWSASSSYFANFLIS